MPAPPQETLTIPSLVEHCLDYGQNIKTICAFLMTTDAETAKIALRLEVSRDRWSDQLTALKNAEPTMDGPRRETYSKALVYFLSELKSIAAVLEKGLDPPFMGNGPPRPSGRFRKELEEAMKDLEKWRSTTDISWYLMMKNRRLNGSSVASTSMTASATPARTAQKDEETPKGHASTGEAPSSGVTLPAEVLTKMAISTIPFSNARMGEKSDTGALYILNDILAPKTSQHHHRSVKAATRDLALKLQEDDPDTVGRLNCKGFVVYKVSNSSPGYVNGKDNSHTATQVAPEPYPLISFTLIFSTPPHATQPRSLRDILLNDPRPRTLSRRFAMARELARSVIFVHGAGFVHKNIRPESVLCFTLFNVEDGISISPLYLVGFEDFRREYDWTARRGDDTIARNLYRHPTRQGAHPEEDYVMQHDIYSLGVCLLEVGLWKSFVEYPWEGVQRSGSGKGKENDEGDHQASTVQQCMPSAALGLPQEVVTGELGSDDDGTRKTVYNEARTLNFLRTQGTQHLVQLAQETLPEVMGTKYAEIVETCLTCLDRDNEDFGDESEFEDEDGVRVGVRYMQKVLLRLNELNV